MQLTGKKLLINILIIFIVSSAYAEERVNLTCNAYTSYDYKDDKFEGVTGTKVLSVFPQSKKYILGSDIGTYKEIGNLITWRTRLINSENYFGSEYVLDRFSGELTDTFGLMKDGSFNPSLSIKYKCKKTEALF